MLQPNQFNNHICNNQITGKLKNNYNKNKETNSNSSDEETRQYFPK